MPNSEDGLQTSVSRCSRSRLLARPEITGWLSNLLFERVEHPHDVVTRIDVDDLARDAA